LTDDPFVGTWEMNPDQNDYQAGQPPKSGTYIIQPNDTGYLVTMKWVTQEDKPVEMSYTSIPDGKDYPYENPDVAEFVSMTRIDDRTLDSATKKGGKQIAHARRLLSEDSQTMAVIQSGLLPGGSEFSNVSVYKKIS